MASMQLLEESACIKHDAAQKVAQSLGWLSIGLGVAEVLAPRALANFTGVSRRPSETRQRGFRKVLAGVGAVTAQGWGVKSWPRLATNVVELARLGKALRKAKLPEVRQERNSNGPRAVMALGALAGIAIAVAIGRRKPGNPVDRIFRQSASAAINLPAEQCYQYWRDLEKLPTFFKHLKYVRDTGEGRAQWVVQGPEGDDISLSIELTDDLPNQRIAWRSVGNSNIAQSGWVRFEERANGRGTIVRAHMQYEIGAEQGMGLFNKLAGQDPSLSLRKSLLRFKQLLETGEIATTEGQSSGRSENTTWLDRAARI